MIILPFSPFIFLTIPNTIFHKIVLLQCAICGEGQPVNNELRDEVVGQEMLVEDDAAEEHELRDVDVIVGGVGGHFPEEFRAMFLYA